MGRVDKVNRFGDGKASIFVGHCADDMVYGKQMVS